VKLRREKKTYTYVEERRREKKKELSREEKKRERDVGVFYRRRGGISIMK
jgi:hypothetical protein